jgi:hypothetical protein
MLGFLSFVEPTNNMRREGKFLAGAHGRDADGSTVARLRAAWNSYRGARLTYSRFVLMMRRHTNRKTSVMAEASPADSLPESERLDVAADQAIAACGGDLRSTIRALILANEFLEYELEMSVSHGYTRGIRQGRFNTYSG